jgi:predicted small lipoprotein YifL
MSNRHLDTFAPSRALPLLLSFFLLAACGEQPPEEAPPAPEAETPAAVETESTQDMADHTVDIQEVNGSGVTGQAMGMHADGSVTMFLELEGLPEEGEYSAHIHSGTCESGGPVAVPLNPVMGLADGTGSSTTILEPDDIPVGEAHFIQVHGQGGTPIACADMEH